MTVEREYKGSSRGGSAIPRTLGNDPYMTSSVLNMDAYIRPAVLYGILNSRPNTDQGQGKKAKRRGIRTGNAKTAMSILFWEVPTFGSYVFTKLEQNANN